MNQDEEAKQEFREKIDNPNYSEPVDRLDRQREKDMEQARTMRGEYAEKWFLLLLFQLVIVNFVVLLLAKDCYLDQWTIRAFFSATIVECFGIAWLVMRYLFPTDKSK